MTYSSLPLHLRVVVVVVLRGIIRAFCPAAARMKLLVPPLLLLFTLDDDDRPCSLLPWFPPPFDPLELPISMLLFCFI